MKTKVLFRIRSLEMGGVQKVLIDILKHLPQENLDITLMVNLFQGELRNEIPKQIKIIKICKGKEDFSQVSLIRKMQLGFRALKLRLLDTFPALMNCYYPEQYDVEIAFGRSEMEMVLKSPQKNSKKIAWVHWEFSHDSKLNNSVFLVKQLEQFDHVFFCSDNVRKQVKELFQVDLKSTSVVYNVIHPNEIKEKSVVKVDDLPQFDEKWFTFVSVGRVKNGKGYRLLFDIHRELINKGLKHRILIIGNGDRLHELRQRAKDENLEESFVLLGNKNNPFPYMKMADCFILPTQSEAYPLSVKEALLMGLPTLVTDVGGVNEIVSDGIDGILMKYDQKDVVQKMELILTEQEVYKKLKSGAEKSENKFETNEIYIKIAKDLTNLNQT